MLSFSNSKNKVSRYPRSNVIHAPSQQYLPYLISPMNDYKMPCFMNLLNADEEYEKKGDQYANKRKLQ